jgi:Flp pilus assembly pilin Flp
MRRGKVVTDFTNRIRVRLGSEEALTIVEYGITIALVSLVIVTSLLALGNTVFEYLGEAVDAAL